MIFKVKKYRHTKKNEVLIHSYAGIHSAINLYSIPFFTQVVTPVHQNPDQMKKPIFAIWGLAATIACPAQELNLGVHLNPTLTLPLLDNHSVHDREIRPALFKPGYNIGANAKLQFGKLNLEATINIVQKSVQFMQKSEQSIFSSGTSRYSERYNNTSFELPLLLGYTIHEHNKKQIYKVDLLAGCSYEYFSLDGTASGGGEYGSAGVSINGTQTFHDLYDHREWANMVVGANIRAIVRHLGLIEYGLSWHIPLSPGPTYSISTTLSDSYGNQRQYNGTFVPKVSYLDFKLCYYFLSYKPLFQRERYKYL